MSRFAAAALVSRSFSKLLFRDLRSSPYRSRFQFSNPIERSSYLHLLRFSTGSCFPPDDSLQGLIDPGISIPFNGCSEVPEHHQKRSFTAKDAAFLEESLAEESNACSEITRFAILISEAISASRDGFGNETQKLLRQFREKLDEKLVIEVLRLVKMPESAVKFFIWAGRQIGYSHTAPVYNALLEILCFDSNNSRVPDSFLKEIGDDDREVLCRLLNVLVRRCCRNGLWNEALEELGRLKDFGFKPSRKTYSALIVVFARAGRLDSAILAHREMIDSGFIMDKFTLGCFAYSLCKAGMLVDALNILDKGSFVLDTVLCTQMIGGLLEASLFEEAMSFLHRMRANSCIPNVVTYRTLLSGFLKQKQLGWCKRILNMMIKEGCNPGLSLFNSLVHAYCISGDYAYAYKLLTKMASCGCRPNYVTFNIFIGGVCGNEELPSQNVIELAESAYKEMLDAGFVLNKVNTSNFARCICDMGKFHEAFGIIKQMMSKGFIPDASTYSKVIGLLCEFHKVEESFLLFEEMKNNGIVPDVYTYTILIDSFCKVGLVLQARKLFNEMTRDGCAPNVVTYTALIHGYLKSMQFSEADELFEKMLGMNCFPNTVTYTAMIDGLCKAGQIDKACSVYSRMKGGSASIDVDTYFDNDSTEVVEPNIYTYGALVDGLCKAHKVSEALDLLQVMSSNGCEPNHIIYDALIDGFCKVGKLEEAQEIFLKMSEHGYAPNVYTYSSLIDKLFKDRRLDLALKVLSKMLESSCAPNVVTYTEMIDGLCKAGKTEEAYKLLNMMEEKGCHPNVVTYTAMIDGFGKAAKVDMSLTVFHQMSKKSCAPNYITYIVLINHCCTAGLLDEADGLLEEMKQTYWPGHTASYLSVIQGFSRKFIASLGLLDEISEYDSIPIVPAYRILIDNFCKAGRLGRALELLDEIESNISCSVPISQDTYSSLVESLCLAAKTEKAFELFSVMTRRGLVPELAVLFNLVKGLIRANKLEEALELSYSICHMGLYWHEGASFGGG